MSYVRQKIGTDILRSRFQHQRTSRGGLAVCYAQETDDDSEMLLSEDESTDVNMTFELEVSDSLFRSSINGKSIGLGLWLTKGNIQKGQLLGELTGLTSPLS